MRTTVTINLPSGWRIRDASEFEESKHPRAANGEFGKGNGSKTRTAKSDVGKESKGEAKTSRTPEGLSISNGKPQGGIALDYDKGAKTWSGEGVDAARLKQLAIPPGWSNVRLAHDPGADLQVLAHDAKGRPQYRYSEAFAKSKQAGKHERVVRLMSKHDELETASRSGTESGSDTAAAVRLMHLTGMRPGGDEDTGADKKAHGATTLLKSHVEVKGDSVSYDFTGKKGVQIKNTVADAALARHVERRLAASDGDRLFNTDAGKANAFVKKVAGSEFKSKDLRTAKANRMAAKLVESTPIPKNEKERVAAMNKVGDVVSSQLGNTRAVALKDYINPAVFSAWGERDGGKD